MALLFPLLLVAAFYFFTMSRRRRAQAAGGQGAAVPGDTVLIGGCIYGTLIDESDGVARVEVARGTMMEVVARTYRKADRPAPAPSGPDFSDPSSEGPDGSGIDDLPASAAAEPLIEPFHSAVPHDEHPASGGSDAPIAPEEN